MKIAEVTNTPQNYLASVRIFLGGSCLIARTTVTADTIQFAKAILTRMYGDGNVLSITQSASYYEDVNKTTRTLSPQELQVKSLSDKAKQYQDQAKAMKARQKISRAQQTLIKAQQGS